MLALVVARSVPARAMSVSSTTLGLVVWAVVFGAAAAVRGVAANAFEQRQPTLMVLAAIMIGLFACRDRVARPARGVRGVLFGACPRDAAS
jgi:NO-binding membrane sensor protein with MHYT domain